MAYKIITQPTEEPLTVSDAKIHLRVDGNDEDALIMSMIVAARESAEHETGRALCTQTRELVMDSFPSRIVLAGAPVSAVLSVKYIDTSGVEQTLAAGNYDVDADSSPAVIIPATGKSWPATYSKQTAVRVRYTCGYGDASDVPAAIKAWMLLAIGTMYMQRESVGTGLAVIPDRFWHRLLDPYRIYEA